MRLLGIDYGTKRVGLALSDESGFFAFPHSVIKNDKFLLKKVIDICKKESVSIIVIGESVDYKGRCNPIMEEINVFKSILENEIKLPVFFENETLTSMEAERLQGKGSKLDASAAAIILRSYIDKKKAQK